MGQHYHGTIKHGPSMARPEPYNARAWHGPVVVPCLGRNFGPGTARLMG